MAADPSVDLWALDEVRFEQHGSRCRMWVPPEVRDPVLLHAPTRKGVGYFGAVRLRDGKFCYRREPDKFNGQTFWEFMKQLRQASCHSGAPRSRHRRQRDLPSLAPSQAVAGKCSEPLLLGLPSGLQPRTEPQRARLEAHPATVLPQRVLPQTVPDL